MNGYLATYRRMLLDMHIPDWDESFLRNYDPVALANLYERANATGVMLYCNSHVGLTNYPAVTGRMHEGLGGRDVVGQLVDELHDRDIKACAYYSVLFDNWAVGEHPDWWVSPIRKPEPRPSGASLPRYGVCCPNNTGYVEFTHVRIADLLDRYGFDCLFYDMTFWAVICGCAACRDRYRAETGADIPQIVDWGSPKWCRFQAAREQWLRGFVRGIVAVAKDVRPDMPVYNNFALSVTNWVPGFALDLADEVDFLGGDMYADRTEQLVVSKLMLNLTANHPAEFMTSLCVNLRDHVRLRSADDLAMKAFAAAAHSSACLFIDAIDPDGTVDASRYDLVGEVFARVAGYEPFLGGRPVEDIAVYHSSESRMSLDENGSAVGSYSMEQGRTPHQQALRGVCRMLQRAHLPFGVITRKQLDDLDRYAVVVLPNVLRMDGDEVHAFREYVRGGGRLYASGYTSLIETGGARHYEFMLADVFGAACDGEDSGSALYAKAATPEIAGLMSPQAYVSLMPAMTGMNVAGRSVRIPDVRATAGCGLLTLSYPYGHPRPGTVFDHHWSSIHSWPPHLDTERAVVVENVFGAGRSIYSAIDIETTDAPVNERLFTGLMRRLLGPHARWSAQAHPAVWVTVFDQPDRRRMTVALVNYQSDLPPVPVRDVRITLRAPPGEVFTGMTRAPGGEAVEHTIDGDTLHATVEQLDDFALLVANY